MAPAACHHFVSHHEWSSFCHSRCGKKKPGAHWRRFTCRRISLQGAITQSWAPYFLLGHPDADKAPTGDCCVGVAHRGREPRSCRSAKRAVPRGLEQAEEPRPPVPIRLCADNCTGPWESPKQAKHGDSKRGLLSFFHSRMNGVRRSPMNGDAWRHRNFAGTLFSKNWLAGNSKPGFRWGCHARFCHSGDFGGSLYLLIVRISKKGPMAKHSTHADACWTYFPYTSPWRYITKKEAVCLNVFCAPVSARWTKPLVHRVLKQRHFL